jgi:hypothetical protein
MKIQLSPQNRQQSGSALVVTAIILMVVCAVLASCLLTTQGEFATVNRSQTWNASIVLTEAGVEDALAFMNKYAGNFNMVPKWCTYDSARQDGWTVSNKVYTMRRNMGTKIGTYDVSIDNTLSNSPVITCVGTTASGVSSASGTPTYMFAAAGASGFTAAPAVRKVQVRATYSALFPGAIITKTNIDLNGNKIRVDSYDSSITNYSIWHPEWGHGTYNVSIARGNGDVATDSSMIGAISVGQAEIYGHLDTGPGGTATIGNNGYVGPLPKNGSGIQPGYTKDDMNVIFPDVARPTGYNDWQWVPSSKVISSSGNYVTYSLYGNLTINASNVVIYVAGNISMSGQDTLTVTTNSGNVVLYVVGPSISLSGNATINNQTQNPHKLAIYGFPSVKSISMNGNAGYTGTVYSPDADFSFGGGGNNTYDYVGSLVANSCKLNGKCQFHYDESLKRNGPGIGYLPASWQELTTK